MDNHWAQTHETDDRIAEAIGYLADGDTNVAERIWQEPTDDEIIEIWERATRHGLYDDREMQWGVQTLHEVVTGGE